VYVCPTCRRRERTASEPEVVFVLKKVVRGGNVAKVATTNRSLDYGGWLAAFFHEPCFPANSGEWRRRPMPVGLDDGAGES
jgi:hypothetical protein